MEYILYTFESSTDAMMAEFALEKEKIKERLVPLLPEIDAGCGLALRFEKNFYKKVEDIFKNNNLSYTEKYILNYVEGKRKPEVLKYDLF